MASENTHREQGGPYRTRSLGDDLGRGAKAADKVTEVRGALRHEGRYLGTYTISEDGKKLTIWLRSTPEDGRDDEHPAGLGSASRKEESAAKKT